MMRICRKDVSTLLNVVNDEVSYTIEEKIVEKITFNVLIQCAPINEM